MLGRLLLTCSLLLGAAPVAAQTTIPLSVVSAYLHLDPADVATDALAIDLASLGLVPGYTIFLETAGDWDAGPGGDEQAALLGVFSSGAGLLAGSAPHRVPGAIDAGLDNYSGPTWPNGQPTEIPEDFTIPRPGITIVIPAGATHLFVTPADIYYLDNLDPDGDLGVTISLVSTTSVRPGERDLSGLSITAQPNPFSVETVLAFRAEHASNFRLTIHDVTGRLVRSLIAGRLPPGDHRVRWDGLDSSGRRVPAGSYFVRLGDGARTVTERLSRLR